MNTLVVELNPGFFSSPEEVEPTGYPEHTCMTHQDGEPKPNRSKFLDCWQLENGEWVCIYLYHHIKSNNSSIFCSRCVKQPLCVTLGGWLADGEGLLPSYDYNVNERVTWYQTTYKECQMRIHEIQQKIIAMMDLSVPEFRIPAYKIPKLPQVTFGNCSVMISSEKFNTRYVQWTVGEDSILGYTILEPIPMIVVIYETKLEEPTNYLGLCDVFETLGSLDKMVEEIKRVLKEVTLDLEFCENTKAHIKGYGNLFG